MNIKIEVENIRPVGARCLINTYKEAAQTESGLYHAEKENEATPVVGVIFKAGTQSTYTQGQVVMFRRYSLDELKFNKGTEEVLLHLVEDEEIVATVLQSGGSIEAHPGTVIHTESL